MSKKENEGLPPLPVKVSKIVIISKSSPRDKKFIVNLSWKTVKRAQIKVWARDKDHATCLGHAFAPEILDWEYDFDEPLDCEVECVEEV